MTSNMIPSTMQAWQKHRSSKEPVRVEVPVPSTPEDGLLVKVHAAGVCHSDLAILEQENSPPGFKNPETFTMGHEGCGEVVSVGSEVTEFARGDMIAVLAVPGCGAPSCAECSKGLRQVCRDGDHYGLDMAGCFAPYIAVKATAAVKLPPGVSAAAGAIATDAIATAYHAVVGRAQVNNGETVLLYGLGGLGFNALQILLGLGARVIAVDRRQEVLDQAVRFGVRKEDIVPPNTTNVAEWIQNKQLTIDKALDFVVVDESLSATVQTVHFGGKIVLVGLIGTSSTLYSHPAIFKHIDILGSFGGTVDDVRASLDLIAKGVINPQVETTSMDNFPQVIKDLHEGKIRSRMVLIPEGL